MMLMTMIIQADMYDDDAPLEYLMRTPVWGLCMILCMHRNSSGRYSVKSGYEVLLNPNGEDNQRFWKWIWKARGTQRVKMFMWEVTHGKIMCNVERNKRGFTNFDGCGLCSSAPETMFHVLRDCSLAMRLWNQLGAEQIENNFFHTNDVFRWLASNLQSIDAQINGVSWDIVFAVGLWWLWKWRNSFVFYRDSHHSELSPNFILNEAKTYLSFIAWQPGGLGWVTVNTNGNVNSRGGGCAGVFRDHFDHWLGGFTLVLGRCDHLEAELWGIQGWEVEVKKIFRETNSVADHFARLAVTGESELVWLDNPDCEADLLLNADCIGVVWSKLI
uniref:Reverse transcriptase zinc-binding domain-containing protein n=1 Tax=Manihot esculenta TaxID=3983 RepID=A0A2C9VV51_MANES